MRSQPAEGDRSLFDHVCAAVGVAAAYVAHDVMRDVGAKLIDEAWFGRSPTDVSPHHTGPDIWGRTPQSLTIDGEITRSDERGPSLDHDLDR